MPERIRRTRLLRALLCLWLLTLSVGLGAQERVLTVMELNVENLFDTLHDAGKDDAAFLPDGAYRWDGRKYWGKLGKLARLLAAAGGEAPIDLVGLCEVENDSCLYDLTQRTRLRRLGYAYAVTHSPDLRGMDVALLYQPLHFRPFRTDELPVPPHPGDKPTRHVLHVGGMLITGDTLDVFVCHLPSRSGGRRQTDAYRLRAASTIRQAVDSIQRRRTNAAILIMGDCNDEANNHSFRLGFRARQATEAFAPDDLVDLPGRAENPEVKGTYKFRRQWWRLDHILVSGSMLCEGASLYTSPAECEILTYPFLLESDGDRGVKPRRTFLGTYYHGGLSDHLPLRLRLYY